MYPRTNYEMTEEDLAEIMDACRPTPVMLIGGSQGPSQQENSNRAWRKLGEKMGFMWDSVKPIPGKTNRFFTAVPSETETQRIEREAREAEVKRNDEIARLVGEIEEKQIRLSQLKKQGDANDTN